MTDTVGGYHCPIAGCPFRAVVQVLVNDHLARDHQENP